MLPPLKNFVDGKKSEMRQRYFDQVGRLPTVVCKNAFLQTSQFQCDIEQLLRLAVAELALCDEKVHDSSLMEHFLRTAKTYQFVTCHFNLKFEYGVRAHYNANGRGIIFIQLIIIIDD